MASQQRPSLRPSGRASRPAQEYPSAHDSLLATHSTANAKRGKRWPAPQEGATKFMEDRLTLRSFFGPLPVSDDPLARQLLLAGSSGAGLMKGSAQLIH